MAIAYSVPCRPLPLREAILEVVRRNGVPLDLTELIGALNLDSSPSEVDVKAMIWELLAAQELQLSSDRKLSQKPHTTLAVAR